MKKPIKKKRKSVSKAGQAWGCCICPPSRDGYFGFETQSAKRMLSHMWKTHRLSKAAITALKATGRIHINRGAHGGSTRMNWVDAKDKPVLFTLSWSGPSEFYPEGE